MPGPEQQARERIDAMLQEAGWAIQNMSALNPYEKLGVAKRACFHLFSACHGWQVDGFTSVCVLILPFGLFPKGTLKQFSCQGRIRMGQKQYSKYIILSFVLAFGVAVVAYFFDIATAGYIERLGEKTSDMDMLAAGADHEATFWSAPRWRLFFLLAALPFCARWIESSPVENRWFRVFLAGLAMAFLLGWQAGRIQPKMYYFGLFLAVYLGSRLPWRWAITPVVLGLVMCRVLGDSGFLLDEVYRQDLTLGPSIIVTTLTSVQLLAAIAAGIAALRLWQGRKADVLDEEEETAP